VSWDTLVRKLARCHTIEQPILQDQITNPIEQPKSFLFAAAIAAISRLVKRKAQEAQPLGRRRLQWGRRPGQHADLFKVKPQLISEKATAARATIGHIVLGLDTVKPAMDIEARDAAQRANARGRR